MAKLVHAKCSCRNLTSDDLYGKGIRLHIETWQPDEQETAKILGYTCRNCGLLKENPIRVSIEPATKKG